ncbi:hypothetical protein J4Q44_G00188700 [Coregonus suidteri]|uniref:Uncharacterized protein n=1 Tax=Coregonus suidteri TaxID=861788 RepID=A0AAN8LGK0_9TELE
MPVAIEGHLGRNGELYDNWHSHQHKCGVMRTHCTSPGAPVSELPDSEAQAQQLPLPPPSSSVVQEHRRPRRPAAPIQFYSRALCIFSTGTDELPTIDMDSDEAEDKDEREREGRGQCGKNLTVSRSPTLRNQNNQHLNLQRLGRGRAADGQSLTQVHSGSAADAPETSRQELPRPHRTPTKSKRHFKAAAWGSD